MLLLLFVQTLKPKKSFTTYKTTHQQQPRTASNPAQPHKTLCDSTLKTPAAETKPQAQKALNDNRLCRKNPYNLELQNFPPHSTPKKNTHTHTHTRRHRQAHKSRLLELQTQTCSDRETAKPRKLRNQGEALNLRIFSEDKTPLQQIPNP
jgi:hypothetical protein